MVNEAEWSLAAPGREIGEGYVVQEHKGVACGLMACFNTIPDS